MITDLSFRILPELPCFFHDDSDLGVKSAAPRTHTRHLCQDGEEVQHVDTALQESWRVCHEEGGEPRQR